MLKLNILSETGDVLWTEEYRTPESLFYRAPDAVETDSGNFDTSVDELVMVPLQSGSFRTPMGAWL